MTAAHTASAALFESDTPVAAQWLIAVSVIAATFAYSAGAARLRRRGDRWPVLREVSFIAAALSLLAADALPLPGGEFTSHMAQHLIIAMATPLLIVLSRPVTLILRALAPGPVRRGLVRTMHSRPVSVLAFPPFAALLDVGGLWLLYRTRLFADTHDNPWQHEAVHLHMLATGLLFTFAVCQLDPVRRRHGTVLRAATLVAAATAHDVLAKVLYGAAPPGTDFSAADVSQGAQLMYYGGDVVEIALAVVLAVQWYARRVPARLATYRAAFRARSGVRYSTGSAKSWRRPAGHRAGGP